MNQSMKESYSQSKDQLMEKSKEQNQSTSTYGLYYLTEESPFSNSEDSMKTHRSVEFFQNYS
jgi:hypothetical protein